MPQPKGGDTVSSVLWPRTHEDRTLHFAEAVVIVKILELLSRDGTFWDLPSTANTKSSVGSWAKGPSCPCHSTFQHRALAWTLWGP